MTDYIYNPKTEGSGVITAIPQTGLCPNKCPDCFFQSGRSYLEPLAEHLPNMPGPEDYRGRVVRVNDGNDSNVRREFVMESTKDFPMKFYNTAIPNNLDQFDGPVVLTINPGTMTDIEYYSVNPIPKNLMMVRIRVNTWNLHMVDSAVKYYTVRDVPVILTFMAYYEGESIPEGECQHFNYCEGPGHAVVREHREMYMYRKRTQNSYAAITTAAWRKVMERYQDNLLVYSCGHIEGEKGKTACKHCGNCLREYFSTMERLR